MKRLLTRKDLLERFLDEICECYYTDDAYECICSAQSDAAIELDEIEKELNAPKNNSQR